MYTTSIRINNNACTVQHVTYCSYLYACLSFPKNLFLIINTLLNLYYKQKIIDYTLHDLRNSATQSIDVFKTTIDVFVHDLMMYEKLPLSITL